MTPEDIQRLMAGNPANRRITVEIVVIEQTRPNGEAAWSKAKKIRQVTVWDAAMKTEKTVTEKGDHMVVTVAGIPEEHRLDLNDFPTPAGRPS